MKTRIIVAAVLLPFFFVTLFFLPPYVLAFVLAAVVSIASYELLRATGAAANLRFYIYAACAAFFVPVGYAFDAGTITLRVVVVLMFLALFTEAVLSSRHENRIKFQQIAVTMFAAVAIPYMLSSLVCLKVLENGKYYVLVPVIAAFISDAGAYFVGVSIGKHKFMPYLSPKKSAEGCIGGLVTATIAMVIYGFILKAVGFTVSMPLMVLYGVIGSVVTQLGDLAFSFIKREYQIKDYGNLLPGHGGMLDRFDSMVFAAPVMCLMIALIPAF